MTEYRSRTIAGIVLAVVIASAIGLAVALYLPSLPSSSTTSQFNYDAYQIASGSGDLVLQYHYSTAAGSGSTNTFPDMGIVNGSLCQQRPDYFQCSGITVTASPDQISYSDAVNTILKINITNSSQADGEYLLFPGGAACGFYIFIIVGNVIPSSLPQTTFSCGIQNPSVIPKISVVGIENMTGLNIPSS